MSLALSGWHGGGLKSPVVRCVHERPVGLKLVIPGWPQVAWGQRERGWVLIGWFALALLLGFWTWGTWLGWGFFAFAFVTQVTSITDVLRQVSFPSYPGRTALVFVSAGLAVLLYIPCLCFLWEIARPGFEKDRGGSGFLVNCLAYHGGTQPREGQWVWIDVPPLGEQCAGRVVAVAGQEVEWTGARWRIDGQECQLHSSPRAGVWPQTCRFTVPSNQVLVEPDDEGGPRAPKLSPLVLVPPDHIIGRVWAHFYPVWDRRLL
jgi:hypothetical protein